MKKRAVVVWILMTLLFVGIGTRIYLLTAGTELQEAAERQSTNRLKISDHRGTIYDCQGRPLVNRSFQPVAAVAGGSRAADLLSSVLSREAFEALSGRLSRGAPFAIPVPEGLPERDGIDLFEVPVRYDDAQLAPHVIGYTDGSGVGVSGMEKAFDEWLTEGGGEISVSYRVDAYGRALAAGRQVYNPYDGTPLQGVVLTLDREIQEAAEEIASVNMEAGAVLVAEAESGAVRAMVSSPGFSVTDLEPVLNDEGSPLFNRAVSAYNAGSVFKLITAEAALERGISPDRAYECTGVTIVSGRNFKCSGTGGHGMLDMEDALAQSCNHYFIRLAQEIGAEPLLGMAERFGLGGRTELAPGMFSAAGALPGLGDVLSPHGLANLSFGQGGLMLTPLQLCGAVQTIANDGKSLPLTLVERTVDGKGETVMEYRSKTPTRIISVRTARLLRQYMKTCVENGTGRPGKPGRRKRDG